MHSQAEDVWKEEKQLEFLLKTLDKSPSKNINQVRRGNQRLQKGKKLFQAIDRMGRRYRCPLQQENTRKRKKKNQTFRF